MLQLRTEAGTTKASRRERGEEENETTTTRTTSTEGGTHDEATGPSIERSRQRSTSGAQPRRSRRGAGAAGSGARYGLSASFRIWRWHLCNTLLLAKIICWRS